MSKHNDCLRGCIDLCLPTAGPGDKTNWQSTINYIEQLERIIYDCTSLRDFMLAGYSEDIYNRILAKYEPAESED